MQKRILSTQHVSSRLIFLSALLFILINLQASRAETQAPANNTNKRRPFLSRFWGNHQRKSNEEEEEDMGQAMRMMTYDRAANERAAIPVLKMGGASLQWFRLDDGVMGGQSETLHQAVNSETTEPSQSAALHFKGTINTNGGGFTSLRAKIPPDLLKQTTTGVRMRFRGDGKTYKFLLSDGTRGVGSPMSRTPSWQVDVPTKVSKDAEDWQEVVIPFEKLRASFGGRPQSRPSEEQRSQYKFDPRSVGEVGIMLSLMLSDGTPNPKETFGEGIFPFSFHIQSIEPVD